MAEPGAGARVTRPSGWARSRRRRCWPLRKASTNSAWSRRTVSAYARPNSTTWSVNARRRPFSDAATACLDLEVDEVLVAVLVAGAVHLRGGPAEQVDDGGHVVGLGDVLPVEVHLVRRHLGHHVADAVHLGVPEQRVGVHLQRALADRGAVALVLEVAVDRPAVAEPAQRRARWPASSRARRRCRAPGCSPPPGGCTPGARRCRCRSRTCRRRRAGRRRASRSNRLERGIVSR